MRLEALQAIGESVGSVGGMPVPDFGEGRRVDRCATTDWQGVEAPESAEGGMREWCLGPSRHVKMKYIERGGEESVRACERRSQVCQSLWR